MLRTLGLRLDSYLVDFVSDSKRVEDDVEAAAAAVVVVVVVV